MLLSRVADLDPDSTFQKYEAILYVFFIYFVFKYCPNLNTLIIGSDPVKIFRIRILNPNSGGKNRSCQVFKLHPSSLLVIIIFIFYTGDLYELVDRLKTYKPVGFIINFGWNIIFFSFSYIVCFRI